MEKKAHSTQKMLQNALIKWRNRTLLMYSIAAKYNAASVCGLEIVPVHSCLRYVRSASNDILEAAFQFSPSSGLSVELSLKGQIKMNRTHRWNYTFALGSFLNRYCEMFFQGESFLPLHFLWYAVRYRFPFLLRQNHPSKAEMQAALQFSSVCCPILLLIPLSSLLFYPVPASKERQEPPLPESRFSLRWL